MKTEHELNEAILKMTMIIAELSPELSGYIAEIPVSLSVVHDGEAYLENLQDYYESLEDMLRKYDAYQLVRPATAAAFRR